MRDLTSMLKGFGNNTIQSLGKVSIVIVVDGVEARVACKVVNDDLLKRPILIGESYTEQV